MPFPVVAVVGAAVKVGMAIWKKSKQKRALTGGRSKQQLLLILRYKTAIHGDFSTLDYGKMPGALYQEASDFFTGLFGVKIEEDDNIKGLFLEGGKAYLRMQDSKWKNEPLKDAQIGHAVLINFIGTGYKEYGDIWKKPVQWNLNNWINPVTVPGHSEYVNPVPAEAGTLTMHQTGAVSSLPEETLPEFTKTFTLENPFKKYWYFFALVGLVPLFLIIKRMRKK